jgi:hypothetical protein
VGRRQGEAVVGGGEEDRRRGRLRGEALRRVEVKSSAGSVPSTMSASVMTPIVFWASFVPCARETSDADPICP